MHWYLFSDPDGCSGNDRKSISDFFKKYLYGTIVLAWTFRIPFFCLAILFLALYGMDQGRDLLLIINSSPLGPITFLITLSILALLNWYLSKNCMCRYQ